MNHDSDMIFEKTETVCRSFIEDFIDVLDFKEMVAGPKSALLGPAPLVCLIAYN
jgi:hypothetical protein